MQSAATICCRRGQVVLCIIRRLHGLCWTESRCETFRRHVHANPCDQREARAAVWPARLSSQVLTNAVDTPMALHPARHIRTPVEQELPAWKWWVPRHVADPSAPGIRCRTICSTVHSSLSLKFQTRVLKRSLNQTPAHQSLVLNQCSD